mmetsp:Transcript_3663/g.4393  ORF Transcript_3663/g.4393 Transcript_3663/m.4393 type:complete len:128 (-) Transcript_3663:567-950(-)
MAFKRFQAFILVCITLFLSATGLQLRTSRNLDETRYSSVTVSSNTCPFSIRVQMYHREYEVDYGQDSGWVETNDCEKTWRVDDLISIGDVNSFHVQVKANGQEDDAGVYPFDSMSSDTLLVIANFDS